MTRSIAADLERRGYIVYVTVLSAEEEHLVQAEQRTDIKALWLDLTAVSGHGSAILEVIPQKLMKNRHPLRRQRSIHPYTKSAP